MNVKEKTISVFHSLIRDKNFWFVILAVLLISVSMLQSFTFFEYNVVVFAVPYAFAWVVLAWALTNELIKRKIVPYIAIFIALFIERIYWFVFRFLYPYPSSSMGAHAYDPLPLIETAQSSSLIEWQSLQQNAFYLFVIVEFVVMLIVFISLWYLVHPKDFTELKTKASLLKSKRLVLVVISSILMTTHCWLWLIAGSAILEWFEFTIVYWYQFIFYALPAAVALVLFAVVITNLKSQAKYVLYGLVGLFTLITYLPFYSMYWMTHVYYIVIQPISYFFVFMSLLLLVKTRHIKQKN